MNDPHTHRIAVTGWSGFVGAALVPYLAARGEAPLLVERDLLQDRDALARRLAGTGTLVHLVGLSHLRGRKRPSFERYHDVNVGLLQSVLDACEQAGVRRLVMLSSLHVFMNDALRGRVTAAMKPAPGDDYGRTKLMAEDAALDWSRRTGAATVILRPPLVYGAGVKGNLAALIRALDNGLPLPLGSAHAARSMVALENLCDAIHFAAARASDRLTTGCYFVQDPQPTSLADLLRAIRGDLGRPARLLPVPVGPMRAALSLIGKNRLANQLFSELIIDDDALQSAGWTPPASGRDDLARMVHHYRKARQAQS